MMERVISVPNETEASFTRNTCDGRRLTYKLKVLQQPERARACGSGAKSSADRRPVDPPPIVELRIYDGAEKAENDITFSMNANYFLFATLEQARPIAQGRVPNDPNRLTVLTGTPVAGMVYLDRPSPAGYFIFPDLSVRHEGKYRLGFSLYEELKEPKDADQLDEAAAAQGEAQITHRLEVKSVPFTVFSAKKFPGLAQSTQLSRMVADQGCRVRIRRDARMRRRETKGDHDGYSDRARHSGTPDLYQSHMAPQHAPVDPVNRERSASIASHVSLAAAPVARRSSGHEAVPPYSQPPYAPQPGGQAQMAHPMPPAQPQYSQAPPQQYAQPQYAPQQHAMQPPQMQPPPMHYQQYQYPQASAPAPAPPAQQHPYYGYGPAMQQAHYEEAGHPRSMSIDYSADSRRASLTQAPMYSNGGQSQTYAPQYSQNGAYTPQQTPKARQMSQVSMSNGSGPVQHVLPPINTALVPRENKLELSPPSSAMSQTQFYEAGRPGDAPAQTNGKRSYDRVFDTRYLNTPLRQGARPSVSYAGGGGFIAADDGHDSELAELESLKMSYRRADGREIARPLPPSHD